MRILIVKLSSLGDVIQTIPALHDLRAADAGAVVDWVVEEAFAPLLAANVDGLARVLPIAQRRWRKNRFDAQVRAERSAFVQRLREQRYDAVIDFQGLVKSALVARSARLAPAGHRYTYGNASEACGYEWPVRYLLDHPVPMPRRVHAVQRYRLLAAAVQGREVSGPPVYDMRCRIDRGSRDIMFAHGTTRADNEWPLDGWIAIGRRLLDAGLRVCVPHAGEAERLRAAQIVDALGSGALLLPAMSLADLPQRMAACGGVIGVDSGLSHLAVALGLPHVQLFSQPRAWRAGPVGREYQRAVGGERAPTVDEVWDAWQAVWACRP